MKKEPLFTGVCTALVTPFQRETVDLPALKRLILRQLDAGIRCLLVGGTTGESSTLEIREWEAVLACSLESARGKALILAGTGTNSLRHTLDRARRARSLGADGQLAVTPYYNKPTQEGLLDYFSRLADGVDLPLILYNVPSRTALDMLPDTVARLAEHPRVRGIKEAGGSLNRVAALTALCDLPVYCGSDEWILPARQLGARGVISVVSNLAPRATRALWEASADGRTAEEARSRQRALSPLIDALFAETNPAPVKAALEMMGLCGGAVRSPLVTVRPGTREQLRALLPGEGTP